MIDISNITNEKVIATLIKETKISFISCLILIFLKHLYLLPFFWYLVFISHLFIYFFLIITTYIDSKSVNEAKKEVLHLLEDEDEKTQNTLCDIFSEFAIGFENEKQYPNLTKEIKLWKLEHKKFYDQKRMIMTKAARDKLIKDIWAACTANNFKKACKLGGGFLGTIGTGTWIHYYYLNTFSDNALENLNRHLIKTQIQEAETNIKVQNQKIQQNNEIHEIEKEKKYIEKETAHVILETNRKLYEKEEQGLKTQKSIEMAQNIDIFYKVQNEMNNKRWFFEKSVTEAEVHARVNSLIKNNPMTAVSITKEITKEKE
jgi:hypothetical protein